MGLESEATYVGVQMLTLFHPMISRWLALIGWREARTPQHPGHSDEAGRTAEQLEMLHKLEYSSRAKNQAPVAGDQRKLDGRPR
jgi:hypothetical protein